MSNHTPQKQQGFLFFGFILIIAIIAGAVFLAMYAYKLDSEIVSKFENRRWDIPATVYSRPLMLSSRNDINPKNLKSWLNMLNYSEGDTKKTGSYAINGNTFTIHTRGFDYGDGDIDPELILQIEFKKDTITTIKSTKPHPKGLVRVEPINIGGIYPENNEDRVLLTKESVPTPLVHALIATEDRTFYEHYGVSVRGTARALLSNITGGARQGGSTITQQLIKNFYLNSDRTLKRKANEALMALLLERHYSKDAILLAYLNEINLGQNGNRSVNGFGVASQFYFNKPLKELRLDQYALLVGIAKGSSYYNPRKYPERAKDRRDTVLHNMLVMGKISQEQYEKAIANPLDVVDTPAIAKTKFPDFFDVVRRELNRYYQDKDLRTAGLKIISTLDPIAQMSADRAMNDELTKLKKKNKNTKNLQGALVSANPHTGELVAIVGSASEFTGFNRAVDAKRQVGSILKPVIYLNALHSGKYHWASAVKDEPIAYRSGNKDWTPKNYAGGSHGDIPMLTALANSYNQSAVNVGMELGIDVFQKRLRQLGIKSPIPAYPSVLLGAVDLSPMEMLGVYQVFASGGYHTPIHSVKQVISEKGKILQRTDDDIKTSPIVPPEVMSVAVYGMQQVVKDGTAKSLGQFGETYALAGKTGTTNDARDAWFAGFSGNYVSVVWVGRDDNKPIGLTGGSGALPIWSNYMKRLNLSPVSPNTEGVSWLWLEKNTGFLTDETCPDAMHVPVITKSAPTQKSACVILRERAESENTPLIVDENSTDDTVSYPTADYNESDESGESGDGIVIDGQDDEY